jgi:endothelin-converting enzyme/putative endopeptidase
MAIYRSSFIALAIACLLTLAHGQQSNAPKPEAAKPEPVLDVTSTDSSVDPCADFFTYSCGGWIKRNPIPPDQSSWDTYAKMADENRERLRGILEAASVPDPSRAR